MLSQDPSTIRPISIKSKDGRSLSIRPARPEDRDAIIQNINIIGAENDYLPSDKYVSTKSWESLFENAKRNRPFRLLLVPEIEEQIIGHGRLLPTGFGHKDSHVVDVGIALIKPYRELGIGTQLLAYMIDLAKSSDYEKMSATIMSSNVRARHLFRRAGFAQEGTRKWQYKISGHYVDEILVALFLVNENVT